VVGAALRVAGENYGAGRRARVLGAPKINPCPVGAEEWGTARSEAPGGLDVCFRTLASVEMSWRNGRTRGPIQRSGSRSPIMSVYALDSDGNLVKVATYSRSS
jgi:hypothetical protein